MTAVEPVGRSPLSTELRALFEVVRRVAPGRTVVQAIAVLLLGLTDGVGLVLLVPVVAALDPTGVIDTESVAVLSALDLDNVSLAAGLAVLVTAVAIRSLVSRWSTVAGTALRLHVVDQLRNDCLDAVLHARWEFVLGRRRSDIVEIVTVGANRVGAAVDQSIVLFTGVVIAFTTGLVAVLIAPLIGTIAVLASFVAALVMLPAIRSARVLGREYGQRSQAAVATTTDALDSLRLVRAHDSVTRWEGALADGFADLRAAQLRHARAAATASAASTVLLMAGSAGFVLVAQRRDMAAGTLLVLLVVLSRLATRFLAIARGLPTLGVALGALGDVERLRSEAEAAAEGDGIGDPSAGPDTVETTGAETGNLIELLSVSCRYPDGTEALRDVDVSVPRGRVTVLVGPTGAGKSTIVDLMLGLLRPTAGTIVADGGELIAGRLPEWRSRIGYVPQELGLLPGTLRDNLVWSASGAVTDDECWSALDAAAASFARELPLGLDTRLGDRGLRLSGGERQRVALARALVRRPELLILDEATSSLDLDTEAEVLAVVRDLRPATTVVIVTHRVGTIQADDHVVEIGAAPREQRPG